MFAGTWYRYLASSGLAVLAALAMSAGAQNPGVTVDVTATAATGYPVVLFVTTGDDYFAPDNFTVKVGQTVRFQVTTVGRSFQHDFLIMSEATNAILAGHPGVIPFESSVTVEWTPTAPGVYRIACAICPWMTGVIHVIA